MPQMDKRNRRATINWSTHSQKEQNETEKCNYGVDWLQKGIPYVPANLDTRLSLKVLDIRRSHKVYRENHEKLERIIDTLRKKLS